MLLLQSRPEFGETHRPAVLKLEQGWVELSYLTARVSPSVAQGKDCGYVSIKVSTNSLPASLDWKGWGQRR